MLLDTAVHHPPPRVDVHQHLWTEPLLEALARRSDLPRARRDARGWRLEIAGEPAAQIEPDSDGAAARAALVAADGLDLVIVAPSSPIGLESLAPDASADLIAAHHDGLADLPSGFAAWGAAPVAEPDPADVDAVLARGCVGLSLPASVLASPAGLDHVGPLLERLAAHDAPLFVHPGPAPWSTPERVGPWTPAWWPALTGYVAQMQAAWHAWVAVGRALHPRLPVVFALLAGLAPLHAERLAARGGPPQCPADPLTFFDISSYGPGAITAMAGVVGSGRLVFGSDRPVLRDLPVACDDPAWGPTLHRNAARLLGPVAVAA